MKILAICGSKRKKGNTHTIVNTVLDALKNDTVQTECITLNDYHFDGCTGCEGCQKSNACVIQDDMQKLYPKIEAADLLILASPTYYYNITADMKKFIERLYCYQVFDPNDRSNWTSVNALTGYKDAAVIAICEQNEEKFMGFTKTAMKQPLLDLGYNIISEATYLHLFGKNDAKKSLEASKNTNQFIREIKNKINF
jgi:multimeric flavodoxin WrbA